MKYKPVNLDTEVLNPVCILPTLFARNSVFICSKFHLCFYILAFRFKTLRGKGLFHCKRCTTIRHVAAAHKSVFRIVAGGMGLMGFRFCSCYFLFSNVRLFRQCGIISLFPRSPRQATGSFVV
jgi:hypothetical protein